MSEEYRVDINIYGKDIETDVGMRILNKYTDAVYQLFNDSMHIDVNNYESPLLYDVTAGAITVVVEDNATNREEFVLSSTIPDDEVYEVQDNENIEIDLVIRNVEFNTPAAGQMRLTLNRNNFAQYGLQPLEFGYSLSNYAVLRKHGRYFYDSRVDGVDIGEIQKGSAILRAARLNWFGNDIFVNQIYHAVY